MNTVGTTGAVVAGATREMSFGEKAVGFNFNPGQLPDVQEVKRAFANVIDILNDKRSKSSDAEVNRMLSIAITETQTAQMWAVKAVTWGK